MSDFIKNLSSYNLFTNLLPGVVFCVLISKMTPIDLIQGDLLTGVFFYYFVGLVISRVGSVIIEPVLKWLKFVSFTKYSDFIAASKQDEKIETLSEINNMYRAILSMMLSICLFCLYYWLKSKFSIIVIISTPLMLVFLLLLFAFAYKKQTSYVKSRILRHVGKK